MNPSGPAAPELPATQGVLAGMPTRLLGATPSRLTTWLGCPRRYRMTYLDRPTPPRGPAWAHSSVGAAVHTALARWFGEPVPARTPGRAGGLLAAAWADSPWQGAGFRDAAQSRRARDRSTEQVMGYVAGLDPADTPRGVERTVALRTPRLALSGRVDRIDERVAPDPAGGAPTDGGAAPTEVVVVDYKTGRSVPDTDDARGSLALAIYAAAAGRTLRVPSGLVELHHLPSGRVVQWRHTGAGLRRHLQRADDIADDIAAATDGAGGGDDPFPARTGPRCSWCDFRAVCPEGRRASVALPPWAALGDDTPDIPDGPGAADH